jgi:putative component of toxin-antitoxin plasmid stabilization module
VTGRDYRVVNADARAMAAALSEDQEPVGDGVSETRIHFDPENRLYFDHVRRSRAARALMESRARLPASRHAEKIRAAFRNLIPYRNICRTTV